MQTRTIHHQWEICEYWQVHLYMYQHFFEVDYFDEQEGVHQLEYDRWLPLELPLELCAEDYYDRWLSLELPLELYAEDENCC